MYKRIVKELYHQRKNLRTEILILGLVLTLAVIALSWNLSLVQSVFAEPNTVLTVESLTASISSLETSINAEVDVSTQTGSLQNRIERLPTAHGVIIKSLRRWEHKQRRKSTAMVSLDLESSYAACVAALREIELWSEITITNISVSESASNERFVVLSITFKDESPAS